MRTEYVVGFAFDEFNRVVLIQKNRPVWQKGKFNAPGGHLKTDESPLEGVEREFKEETGFLVENWKPLAIKESRDWIVHVFYARDVNFSTIKTTTDEVVRIFPVNKLPNNCLSDVYWLVPMALHTEDGGGYHCTPVRIWFNRV